MKAEVSLGFRQSQAESRSSALRTHVPESQENQDLLLGVVLCDARRNIGTRAQERSTSNFSKYSSIFGLLLLLLLLLN